MSWDVTIEPPETLSPEETRFSAKSYTAEWIATLPLVSSSNTIKQLHSASAELASHRILYDGRLFFLEKTAPIVCGILQDFMRQCHREGLPLRSEAVDTARLLLELLARMVVGYRQVLQALNRSLFAGGLRRSHLLTLCMLRLLELLGRMIELYRYISVPPAAGLWLLHNRVYLLAEAAGLLHKRVRQLAGRGKHSIETVFKSQLLLDSLSYFDLRYEELEQAKGLIESLSRHIHISSYTEMRGPQRFCFRLDEDAPPFRYVPNPEQYCAASEQRRVLELKPMLDRLETMLTEEATQSDLRTVPHLVAAKLMNEWRNICGERDRRIEGEQPVRTVHGLSSIVALLAREQGLVVVGDRARQDESETVVMGGGYEFGPFSADIDGLDPLLHEEMMQQEYDEWSIVPYVPGRHEEELWAKNGVEDEAAFWSPGRMVNRSDNGFGIELPQQGAQCRYRSGELLALEYGGERLLCVIRWVKIGAASISLGLGRLGSALQPRSLMVSRNGNATEPLPVLLIRYRDELPALVMHNLNLKGGQRIALAGEQLLDAESCLEASPSFVCFRLDELEHERLLQEGRGLDQGG